MSGKVIVKESTIDIEKDEFKQSLNISGDNDLYKKSVFFDLEHYVYKKPICIGVFGAGYYDEENNKLVITQYMIENKHELEKILALSKEYFENMRNTLKKEYVVTFSGNNDYLVIDYLFKKYKLNYTVEEYFKSIDLQKKYEQVKQKSIGLKALESECGVLRESEVISGSTLAKTFSKIMKDDMYFSRMPMEKKEKILLYNMQDVVSLFHIYTQWNKYVRQE
ncbi:ribonuclease H-like domain-containing protein [Clostridium subterminale]|uniref:ribonuclease H-like domain-containing protein n=1 Tax=Clostridium subterminale TaxID=1550 RepID=UPI0031D2D20F